MKKILPLVIVISLFSAFCVINLAKIAGTKNALIKILADISKYEQAYKIQQERVNTVGTDEQINKLREYGQILVGLYQLRDKAKNEILNRTKNTICTNQ